MSMFSGADFPLGLFVRVMLTLALIGVAAILVVLGTAAVYAVHHVVFQ